SSRNLNQIAPLTSMGPDPSQDLMQPHVLLPGTNRHYELRVRNTRRDALDIVDCGVIIVEDDKRLLFGSDDFKVLCKAFPGTSPQIALVAILAGISRQERRKNRLSVPEPREDKHCLVITEKGERTFKALPALRDVAIIADGVEEATLVEVTKCYQVEDLDWRGIDERLCVDASLQELE
ncbi:hypothetical protein, partial [Sphingomonas sp. CFBP 13714]|uniref:hypothetical protein n=1 Tax=Sphingomonas sp. CFBP 13714 TaxID=2775308 RepID=UPI001A7EB01A